MREILPAKSKSARIEETKTVRAEYHSSGTTRLVNRVFASSRQANGSPYGIDADASKHSLLGNGPSRSSTCHDAARDDHRARSSRALEKCPAKRSGRDGAKNVMFASDSVYRSVHDVVDQC